MKRVTAPKYIHWFKDLSIKDIALVGGKTASLGEMYRVLRPQGIRIPNGFAISAKAYRDLIEDTQIGSLIRQQLASLDVKDLHALKQTGSSLRHLIQSAPLPNSLVDEIAQAYEQLCQDSQNQRDVAVRSSATAEDLPNASFAGQQESFLNVNDLNKLLNACSKCFASLFTDRAISYRIDQGFDHAEVALSICVQRMVRSDRASAGVIFTIDTESGFKDAILISGAYGLGETVVQGTVEPDEFYVFKPTLKDFRPIISKSLGAKKTKLIYDELGPQALRSAEVSLTDRQQFILNDEEILTLARWSLKIEEHYSQLAKSYAAMDIEWAKDGYTNELFVVQARPETVVSSRSLSITVQHVLDERGPVLATGRAVGQRIGQGLAHVIANPCDIKSFKSGEVLVTSNTDPNWEPIMKCAAAIVTERGGRTSHAAIVSRELGIPCIVGALEAMQKLQDPTPITVCCAEGAEGRVYAGLLKYHERSLSLGDLPEPPCKIMLNLGDPEQAFALAYLPNDGVGLARMEFIISAYIRVHPLALINLASFDDSAEKHAIESIIAPYGQPADFFVSKLAEGLGRIAAAFFPKPVIARMSDFKSNEYASLLGGAGFEPKEENPMIGWRGASRYYDERYSAGFALECAAISKVREEFGLTNLHLMIPFCRTPAEATAVSEQLNKNGLTKSPTFKHYCMCEIPSNVLMADEFLDVFDGFSIGSNDLTQLTLGLDRDSSLVNHLFDERSPAVKKLIAEVITVCKTRDKYIGICGDAPSTYPEFARFLVDLGIDSLSLSPDALLATRAALK